MKRSLHAIISTTIKTRRFSLRINLSGQRLIIPFFLLEMIEMLVNADVVIGILIQLTY